jgi:hypothetical protein
LFATAAEHDANPHPAASGSAQADDPGSPAFTERVLNH